MHEMAITQSVVDAVCEHAAGRDNLAELCDTDSAGLGGSERRHRIGPDP